MAGLVGCALVPTAKQAPLVGSLTLDLEDAGGIRAWVDDPGGPGGTDVGDAVFGR